MRQIFVDLSTSEAKKEYQIKNFVLRCGENKATKLVFQLSENMQGEKYYVTFQLVDERAVITPELTATAENTVEYEMPGSLYTVPGWLKFDLTASRTISANEKQIIKSATILIEVVDSLTSSEEVLDPYVPGYEDVVAELRELKAASATKVEVAEIRKNHPFYEYRPVGGGVNYLKIGELPLSKSGGAHMAAVSMILSGLNNFGDNKPSSMMVQFATRPAVRVHASALDGNTITAKIGYVQTSAAVELWLKLVDYAFPVTCHILFVAQNNGIDSYAPVASGRYGQKEEPPGWTEAEVLELAQEVTELVQRMSNKSDTFKLSSNAGVITKLGKFYINSGCSLRFILGGTGRYVNLGIAIVDIIFDNRATADKDKTNMDFLYTHTFEQGFEASVKVDADGNVYVVNANFLSQTSVTILAHGGFDLLETPELVSALPNTVVLDSVDLKNKLVSSTEFNQQIAEIGYQTRLTCGDIFQLIPATGIGKPQIYDVADLNDLTNYPSGCATWASIIRNHGTLIWIGTRDKRVWFSTSSSGIWTPWVELVNASQLNALFDPTVNNIQFKTGYQTISSNSSKYRKMNGVVFLEIEFKKTDGTAFTTNTWTPIAQLPVGFRPSSAFRSAVQTANNGGTCAMNINSTGEITVFVGTQNITTIGGCINFYVGGGTV